MAVASAVFRLNPARARQAPVRKWVTGSKVYCSVRGNKCGRDTPARLRSGQALSDAFDFALLQQLAGRVCQLRLPRYNAPGWKSRTNSRKMSHGKAHNDADGPSSQLFVTRCILAPGAPLNPFVESRDVLIVGMNNGELVNEKKSPQSHVNVFNGLVILMPKEEPYLLRNTGKGKLELLVIEVGK